MKTKYQNLHKDGSISELTNIALDQEFLLRLSKTQTENLQQIQYFLKKKYFQNVSTLRYFKKLLEIVFRENFERAYIEATEQFYNVKAPQQLALEADGEKAGVFGYMKWAEAKLREEEQRALKYLETSTGNPFI